LVLACGATTLDTSGTTLVGEAAWNQGFSDTDPQVDSSAGGSENLGYDATPGWDACTGLGGPVGNAVLAVLEAANPQSETELKLHGRQRVQVD